MKELTDHGFEDRPHAGRLLTQELERFRGSDHALVLALPRGGVPVAAEIARVLSLPLDVLVVRKLGVPGHEEVAMGAIASGGVRTLNEDLVSQLRIGRAAVDAVIHMETEELLRREHAYRGDREPIVVAGRTVIVVDDGMATGSTMVAAVRLLRERNAGRVIVAVPVAAPDAAERLSDLANEVVTVIRPDPFIAVGRWYRNFAQTSDAEVKSLLTRATRRSASHMPTRSLTVEAARAVRNFARPLTGSADDWSGLLDWVGDASIVMLGESTHGTHEFYRQRARITQRLIEEKEFNAVATEADWPDACRVNRFVRCGHDGSDSVEALAGFDRFPAWMWRNADVLDFTGWLRNFNEQACTLDRQAGFYGVDLYSLHKSMNEVIAYLERTDPSLVQHVRTHYSCIDRHGPDPQHYGLLAASGMTESCRKQVIRVLTDLCARRIEHVSVDGRDAADEQFYAVQNARVVCNAEEYYRNLFRSDVSSWNLRDRHMSEALVELAAHLQSQHGRAKIVVWAHNSHVGDARATDMSRRGECNLGQLVREAFPGQSKIVGFTTYTGSVTAASGWHLPAERKRVRPAVEDSYEHLFHQVGIPGFWLDLTAQNAAVEALRPERLERAIGVVYLPQSELRSHCFHASMPGQFDAVVHFDRTRAVEPLERTSAWCVDEAPETFPAGV
jgi:erythromycin esterase-like protein/predicted phosphoribosyltransferase